MIDFNERLSHWVHIHPRLTISAAAICIVLFAVQAIADRQAGDARWRAILNAPTPTSVFDALPDRNILTPEPLPIVTPIELQEDTDCVLARTGAVCVDGSSSDAIGPGACSHHSGVAHWVVTCQ
jgi:hypothetical protein